MHKSEKINNYHRTHGSFPSVTGSHVLDCTQLSFYGAPSLAKGLFLNWLDQVSIVVDLFFASSSWISRSLSSNLSLFFLVEDPTTSSENWHF